VATSFVANLGYGQSAKIPSSKSAASVTLFYNPFLAISQEQIKIGN